MTKEKKQELSQLLEEATKKENLEIRYGSALVSLPSNLYARYLEERWTYYGVDFLSFWLPPRITPEIVDKTIESKLRSFIRAELSQFIYHKDILRATYLIEDGSHLCRYGYHCIQQHDFIKRLLEIAIARGIKESVSVFDRCSCPEGVSGVFQHVVLLGGIKLEKTIEVFEGVRLIPLPSLETSQEVMQHLTGFPRDAYVDDELSFYGKTLFVIDRPGFSMFHSPSDELYEDATQHSDELIQDIIQYSEERFKKEIKIDDLPFPVKVHSVRFPNMAAVHFFRKLFCQALSLACNSPVQIIDLGLFFYEPDKSFNSYETAIHMLNHSNPFEIFTAATEEADIEDIEKAKCLYKILDTNSEIREKLQIPIDRWIQSKAGGEPVDKMIDLGIAFEALYVPDGGGDITYKFSIRAARHLGKDKEDRNKLLTKFKQIYDCRSKAVHNGKLEEMPKFGKRRIPASDLIKKSQNFCRKSIMKVLNDGCPPNKDYWNNLMLGGEE